MYTPAPGFIGFDKCEYETCAVYTDLASGWPEVDPEKCFTATVTISVIECARLVTPEVRDRKNVAYFFFFTLISKCFIFMLVVNHKRNSIISSHDLQLIYTAYP